MAANPTVLNGDELEMAAPPSPEARGPEAIPAPEDVPAELEKSAAEELDAELGRRFRLAQEAALETQAEMKESLYRRNGKYMPRTMEKLKADKGARVYSNITEQKCAGAEAPIVKMLVTHPAGSWGLKPTPIPELSPVAQEAAAQAAFERTGQPAGEEFDAAYAEFEAELKKQEEIEAKSRAAAMEKLIRDQFQEGDWLDATLDVIDDFCTFEVAGWMGPLMRTVKEAAVESDPETGAPSVVVRESVKPFVMRMDPLGVFPAATSRKAADGDFFYRTTISDDAAVEMFKQPNVMQDRMKVAYSRKGDKLGDGNADDLAASEIRRQGDGSGETWEEDGTHELVYFWHRMTRAEAAGARREELQLQEGERPDERISYMGLILNGVVVSLEPNWDPLGRPQVHLCSYRRRPGSVFGKSLPWLNKDSQNTRNVTVRALHNNLLQSARSSYIANMDLLENPSDVFNTYPGKVFQARVPHGQPDGRRAIEPIQTPNYTVAMLSAANQAGAWSDEATGVFPQAYGSNKQIGPAETMGGYQMLREDQMTITQLAIVSLDAAQRSLVRAFWLYNMLSPGHDDCKGDMTVETTGLMKLSINSEDIAVVQAMLAFFRDNGELVQQYMQPGALPQLLRDWMVLSNRNPDEMVKTDDDLAREAEAAARAAETNPPPGETPPEEPGEVPPEEAGETTPPPKPESESDRIRAEADLRRAQAAERKVEIEEGKLALQRAQQADRLRALARESREARGRLATPPRELVPEEA